MHVITIASRKGGAGRTTVASLMAVEACRCGYGPVAMLDTDEMGGLTKWWEARKAETPVLAEVAGGIAKTLAALKKRGFQLVVIDTASSSTKGTVEVMEHADLVLVPVQPSPDDLRAVGATLNLARSANRKFVFVLNQVKKRTRITADAAKALSRHGPLAPATLGNRTSYAEAKTGGLSAPEVDPNGPAAAEVAALWAYIEETLGLKREAVCMARQPNEPLSRSNIIEEASVTQESKPGAAMATPSVDMHVAPPPEAKRQLSYRPTVSTAEQLRLIGCYQRRPVQALIDEAVLRWLAQQNTGRKTD